MCVEMGAVARMATNTGLRTGLRADVCMDMRADICRDTFCGNTPLGKDGSNLRRAMNPHTRIDAPVCALVCMHGYPQVHVLASQCTLVYTG